MKIDSILFDLDGTLWDAVDAIVATWNIVLVRHPGLREPITRREQETVMGLQMDEIARKLFPKEPPARQTAMLEECVLEEQKYLYDHGGTLYPGVVETLEQLHKKYPLYIVSNCQSGYIETFLHAHSLESYFDGFTCYGDTKLSKGENNRLLIQRYGLQHPVYVGDTAGDQKSALDAGIPFVYAAYGFGQVAEYDAKIESFGALQNLFLNRI